MFQSVGPKDGLANGGRRPVWQLYHDLEFKQAFAPSVGAGVDDTMRALCRPAVADGIVTHQRIADDGKAG